MDKKKLIDELRPEFRKKYSKTPFPSLRNPLGFWLQRILMNSGARSRKEPAVCQSTVELEKSKIRLYQPIHKPSRAGLIFIHGGGMVMGTAKGNDRECTHYADELGIVVASVEYRVAPEHPYPAAIDDCFATWLWVQEHAEELGVDPNKIAIAGQSAGGGLSAALAQRVLDAGGPQPAAQILFYPMLDDRTAARDDLTAINHIGWYNTNNHFGWSAYLGHDAGSLDETPPWSVPGRRQNLERLAPTWIGVGDKDLFFEESCDYAERLKVAGVECELNVVDGAPHGFDILVPNAESSISFVKSANRFLIKKLGIYD